MADNLQTDKLMQDYESEQLIRSIIELSPDIISIISKDGALLYNSPAAFNIHGYSREELIGRNTLELIHPDDREEVDRAFQQLLNVCDQSVTVRYRYRNKDGSYQWMDCKASNHIATPQINGIIAISRAITVLEQELLQAKEKYRALIDSTDTGFVILDTNGRVLDANKEYVWLTGHETLQQIKGRPVTDWTAPYDLERNAAEISKCINRGFVKNLEIDYQWPRGESVSLEINASTVTTTDGLRILTLCHDISDRRKAEQTLRESEERYRAIVDNSFDVIFILDKTGTFRFVCPSWEQHFGYPASEVLGRPFAPVVHPDDVQPCYEFLLQVMTTGLPGTSPRYRVKCSDGSWKAFIANGSRYIDTQGEMLFHGVGRDISEQEQLLFQLSESELKFKTLFLTVKDAVFLTSASDGKIVECNEYLSGYSREEIIGKSTIDLMLWEDPASRQKVVDLIASQGYVNDFEAVFRKKGGELFTGSITANAVTLHGKIYLLSIVRDITERKLMEISLRESENRYRRFIATANEGISITDRDFVITYSNPRLAEMLGYSPEELIGKQVVELLPLEDRSDFANLMAERSQGINSRRECRHLCKDGSEIWLFTSSTPVMLEDGTFQGTFAMFTDLTDRKTAENCLQHAYEEQESRVTERTAALAAANKQIREMSFELIQAEEQERTRIASELHDQVGQSLLLAKMKIDALSSHTRTNRELESAAELSSLLDNCIQDIRTLTFGMRPPLLDTAGIEAALEWLCASIRRDYQLQVDFSCNCLLRNLSGEMRYAIYQSIRELLLNIAKHAGVNRAKLSFKTEESNLVVQISDTGAGFDKSAYDNRIAICGLGLYNVQQRIEGIGGCFVIDSTPGRGTSITLTIPLGG